jgi:deoxyribodipyrimidine photo-lyase
MVVASFLVKHLLIHWRHGADWFWDTLVDADLASNTQGWQWTAGSGADAAPYFRIFNPTTQAIKFDPDGDYIRKWIPELRHMSAPDIFEPSKVDRGQNYPNPIVDHSDARDRALKAYEKTKA